MFYSPQKEEKTPKIEAAWQTAQALSGSDGNQCNFHFNDLESKFQSCPASQVLTARLEYCRVKTKHLPKFPSI